MPIDVGDAYDLVAERYAALFLSDLDGDTNARHWLDRFAAIATTQSLPVADLGCGPGHVTSHLAGLGMSPIGYDVSPGQIAEARKAFPDGEYHLGDLCSLEVNDASIGGIVSRYSVIHLPPTRIHEAFDEWSRVLAAGAPVLVSFFGASSVATHGTPFEHTVATAYALHPQTIGSQLEAAGFCGVELGVIGPPEGGRPYDQATVLARRSA